MEIRDDNKSQYPGWGKIIHNAMLMNTHKDKDFLQYLFDRGVLHFFEWANPNQEAINEFFKLLDLFEEKYKHLYDLGFYGGNNEFTLYFKVLYPEFTITNSLGEMHEIRDLFVVHPIAYGKDSEGKGHIYTKHPLGGRLSKTQIETKAGYQQSHLSGIDHITWKANPFDSSPFCVGGDTDVSRMIAEFKVEMDWDRYELYLFCIDSMVTWESLEGVPYRKMADIKNAFNNKVTNFNSNNGKKIINKIIADKLPLNLDFYIENGIFKIKPNEKANDFIKQIILQTYSFDNYKTILVTRVPNTFDQFLQLRDSQQQNEVFTILYPKRYTLFRGQKIFAKIIKEDKRKDPIIPLEEAIVYPKFLNYVLSELESRIYGKAVTKSGIKIYNSLSNAHRSVTSDTISM